MRVLRNSWREKPVFHLLHFPSVSSNWLIHCMREETKCNHRKALIQLESHRRALWAQVNSEVLFYTLVAPSYHWSIICTTRRWCLSCRNFCCCLWRASWRGCQVGCFACILQHAFFLSRSENTSWSKASQRSFNSFTSCEVQNIENVCLFQLCLWSGISLCSAGLKEEGISGEYNFWFITCGWSWGRCVRRGRWHIWHWFPCRAKFQLTLSQDHKEKSSFLFPCLLMKDSDSVCTWPILLSSWRNSHFVARHFWSWDSCGACWLLLFADKWNYRGK